MFDIFTAMEVVEKYLLKSKIPDEYMNHWRKHRIRITAAYILGMLLFIQCAFVCICFFLFLGDDTGVWQSRIIYGSLITVGINVIMGLVHKNAMKHFNILNEYMKQTGLIWNTGKEQK